MPLNRRSTERLRVAVLGYIVRGPLGGMAWHHLQYVLGLDGMGHDVIFVEDSDDYPSCYDPVRHTTDADPTYGLAFIKRVFDHLGLADRWGYFDAHTGCWMGPNVEAMPDICASADLVLNVSGVNPIRPWLMRAPVRALIDTDPCFTQIRHLTDGATWSRAEQHTAFLTFGENIGTDRASVPDDGLPWQPTRQPVVLDAWPVAPGPPGGRFTTVMQWSSYPAREYQGQRFGMKSDSLAPFLDLPRRAGAAMELAMGGASAPRERLRRHGWLISDPLRITRSPRSYQRFVQRSTAEFSVAKSAYVASRSGWFSERSCGYLASGRPVVVQDTGFTDLFDVGAGVVAFSSLDEAVAGIEAVTSDYEGHCRAARAFVAEHFEATHVLNEVIAKCMDPPRVAPPPSRPSTP